MFMGRPHVWYLQQSKYKMPDKKKLMTDQFILLFHLKNPNIILTTCKNGIYIIDFNVLCCKLNLLYAYEDFLKKKKAITNISYGGNKLAISNIVQEGKRSVIIIMLDSK